EIVDAAVARGFVVKVLSNATMITDEVADRFARAGVIEVSISVYGASPEVHDRVTEMPGSWERTIAGIKRLRARNIHVVTMMPVVVGNLRETPFAELWNGHPLFDRLHAIEQQDLHECGGCDVAHACSRCPGLAVQRGQDIDGCDLTAKQVARARVEARMRLR